MTKSEEKALRAEFKEIPVAGLFHRYWISGMCDIIDVTKSYEKALIYHWDPISARQNISIMHNGNEVSVRPIELYMITFYGYLPFKIIEISNGNPKLRYRYKLPSPFIFDLRTISLGDIQFKRYQYTSIYVSNLGVIYNLETGKLYRHTIDAKGYHIASEHRVHHYVYCAWVGEIESNCEIHHLDSNPWHNTPSNLQQLTPEKHKLVPTRNFKHRDEVVERVCELMANGMRPVDAARLNGVNPINAVEWRNGSRPNISKRFTYPELEGFKLSKLTDKDVREICELFERYELSNAEIAQLYSVSKYTIQDIRKGITWRTISAKYNFNPNDPKSYNPESKRSTAYSRRNSSITEDDVIRVWKLLQNHKRIIDVHKETGISYSIIKKIKYKTRWASVTDKLGPLDSNCEEGSTTIERVS